MTKSGINTFRIETNYAAVQGSHWASFCIVSVFVTVYLSFKGLTDTQIGFTSALLFMIAILFQIVISNFADSNTHIPLKKIVTILYIVAVIGCVLLWLLPLSVALIIIVYSITAALQSSNIGFTSALMMQFTNIGLPVNYGWPRGIGSISYALSAYILGIFVEEQSPEILMPISIVLLAVAIISVSLMPNPDKLKNQYRLQSTESKTGEKTTSYWKMIRHNPTLILFLTAVILLFSGFSSILVFLIRIIESLGGNARDLGLSMFIHSGMELPILLASGMILRKFKVHDILVVSFFCFFVRGVAIYFAPSVGAIYGILAFNIVCMGLYAFAAVYFVNNIVGKSEKVRAQSIVIVCQNIGGIIGSSVGGLVIDSAGLGLLITLSWIVLLIAALVMLVCRYKYTRQFPVETVAAIK